MAKGATSQGDLALVTGGAGFIGAHVVRRLLDEGCAVRVLYLPGEDLRNLAGLGDGVELVPGDVTDASAVKHAVRGCDRVFHLAALYALWTPDPARLRAINVDGTENVLAAAASLGRARVVYTSSIAVFGGQGPGRDADEESTFRLGATGDVYARSKHEAHQVALAWAARGLDVVIVAPTGPIGPGDVRPTPTGRLILSAVNLPVPVVVESCGNVIDVRDCAAGHVLAAQRGQAGETYLLGHENISPKALAHIALAIAGQRRPVLRVPHGALSGLARGLEWASERITRQPPLVTPAAVEIARLGLRARCDKAARVLALPTRPVSDSVRDALVWFARHGYVRSPRVRRRLLAQQ